MNNIDVSPLSEYELKLYKEFYKNEELRRQYFSGKTYQSITYLIAIISATVWLIIKFMKIYSHKPCWLNFVTIDLLLLVCTVLCVTFCKFFKTLYGYKGLEQDPTELEALLKEYKMATNNVEYIIDTTNESLAITYKEAAINAYQENDRHIKMFEKYIKTAFLCVILISITFIMEVVVYGFF